MGKDLRAPPFDPANRNYFFYRSFVYLFMSVEENYTFAALGILKLEGG